MTNLNSSDRAILAELSARQHALDDLEAFREYISHSAHADFTHPPAPHHRVIQDALMELETSQKLDGVILELPPGSAKSTYGSIHYPLWHLARNPSHKIVAISNTTSLAEDFSRRRRSVALDDRWQLLSSSVIPKDNQSLANFGTDKGGSMLALGMGSAVSGRRANLAIVDDPILGIEQANSMAQLDKQWQFYEYEVRNRLVPGGKQVIISTRWSQWDIIGRIKKGIADGTEKRRWKIVTIPMEANSPADPLGRKFGERLWPEWFTEEMVAENKSDPLRWSALYQQEPIDASGTWVDEGYVRYCKANELPPALRYVSAIDLALSDGTGDDTAIVTAGLSPDRTLYIVDVHLDKVPVAKTLDKLTAVVTQFNPSVVLIEDSPAERVFVDTAREYSRNGFQPVPLYPMPTRGRDKETRAAAIRSLFMSNKVVLVEGKWNHEALKQILNFPPKSKALHDDFIDAIALIGRHIGKQNSPQEHEYTPAVEIQGGMTVDKYGQMTTTATLDEMWTDHETEILNMAQWGQRI